MYDMLIMCLPGEVHMNKMNIEHAACGGGYCSYSTDYGLRLQHIVIIDRTNGQRQ
jgi:hypothetical protein